MQNKIETFKQLSQEFAGRKGYEVEYIYEAHEKLKMYISEATFFVDKKEVYKFIMAGEQYLVRRKNPFSMGYGFYFDVFKKLIKEL